VLNRANLCPRLGKRQRALLGQVGELVCKAQVLERLPERGRSVGPCSRLQRELGQALLVLDSITERASDDEAIDS
jgi:hypothetical protein